MKLEIRSDEVRNIKEVLKLEIRSDEVRNIKEVLKLEIRSDEVRGKKLQIGKQEVGRKKVRSWK